MKRLTKEKWSGHVQTVSVLDLAVVSRLSQPSWPEYGMLE